MAIYTIRRGVDLDAPIVPEGLRGDLYVTEDSAHRFIVTATRGGEPVMLDGQVVATFIRADGGTVELTGGLQAGAAAVTLEAACYAVPGRFALTVYNAGEDGSKTAVYACVGNVINTTTDTPIDPGTVVPDVSDIVAEYTAMQAAVAAAQAAAVAGNTAADAIMPYNAGDVLALWQKSNVTTGGVTYTWQSANTCLVTGTNTGSSAVGNIIWSNKNALPHLLTPGKKYRVIIKRTGSTTDLWYRVRWCRDGSTWGNDVWPVDGGTLTVPADAVGVNILLGVSAGNTVDGTITLGLIDGVSNAELAEELTGVHASADKSAAELSAIMPYNAVDGVASIIHTDETSNNVNFHWIDGNSCEVTCTAAASASAYTWIFFGPSAFPEGFAPGKTVRLKYSSTASAEDAAVWLEVRMYPTGVWSGVRYYRKDDVFKIPDEAIGMSYRLTVAQGLEPDETVTVSMVTESGAGRSLSGKYVAFGDSLTLGAVYSTTPGGSLHYANRAYRIPARIARAVGAFDNYEAVAVGGIGYTHPVSNQTLVDLITSQGTSFYNGVELVTVMGGANDKLTADGTLDAICEAISQIIAYFHENYPTIQLVFIQPLPSGLDETHNPWTGRGLGGWSLVDFDEAVSKLCYEAHVGYASWLGCTYCDTWAERNVGYNGSSTKNYTHPVVDEDYALIGDFIAGKVAQYGQNNKPITDAGVKAYTTADMYTGSYWHFGREYTYFNPFTGRRATDQYYNCLWFPVKTGDVVRLRTMAGSNNAKPYALIGSDRLIYDLYTDGDSFDGEITIQQDGFVAVNTRNPETYGYYDFMCEVRTSATDELRKLDRINALPIQTERQQFLEYDDNDVCKVLVTGPSRMSMIHNWAIIGASFDSGEFNHALTVYPTVADYQAGTNGRTHWAEYEGYEYSCFEYLKRINGIPNMYLYSNGGQNSRDWIRYGPTERKARTWAYTTGELEVVSPYYEDNHFWYISDDPNDPRGCTWHSETDTYTPGGNIAPYRTGAGHAGGNWWKLREDLEAGTRYNAYLINLGSNDLNNNHDFPGDPVAPSEGPAYDAGTLADIGTYDRTTDTDTVPTGKTASVVPGVVNSYAAYMGAILNRIFAYQPDAIVFVATIRNGFSQNSDRLTAWNAYNDVLKDIVASSTAEGGLYYGKKLYLLDNAAFGPCYDVPPMNGMFVHNHPNALGYQYIAGYWNTLIDHAIQKNYLAMQQSMFIGTNMTGTV